MSAADATSLHDFAEQQMARRVRQGYPERFAAMVDGTQALGFDWTDGVANILSYFAVHPRGPIVELSVIVPALPEPPAPILTLAAELIHRVRWR
jgi:hypothetical protein